MNKTGKRVFALLLQSALLLGIASCGEDDANYDFTVDAAEHTAAVVSSGVSVHDPSIFKDGDTYYIFGSHMAAAKCDDLFHWTKLADGYNAANPVYGQIYSVADKAFAYAGSGSSAVPTDDGGVHVWAPDVVYNKAQGLYYMYYCTSSTWSASNLCYGVSSTPEGPYEWKGALICSGFTKDLLDKTNVLDYVTREYAEANYFRGSDYDYKSYPNAIDPSVFYDGDGRMWMVYGSWSGGIFLLEIDEQTGEPIHPEADPANDVDPYFGRRLLGGGHNSIEGPYILWDAESGYYYLFVSYGALTSEGGYQIRVFRSQSPEGPYEDMNGMYPKKGTNHAICGLKLSGNYYLPSLHKAYMATGHNSALCDSDGKKYIVYHTRFQNSGEMHSPRVHQFLLNAEGWPCMLPYQTQGETVSPTGYEKDQVVGRYYVIDQGTGIDAEVAQPVIFYLTKNGKVVGEEFSGTWTAEKDSYHMTITLGDDTFSGVFCVMPDEAGSEVMTFSAVGLNRSVWGVKYAEESGE